jgi:hypothetical protein
LELEITTIVQYVQTIEKWGALGSLLSVLHIYSFQKGETRYSSEQICFTWNLQTENSYTSVGVCFRPGWLLGSNNFFCINSDKSKHNIDGLKNYKFFAKVLTGKETESERTFKSQLCCWEVLGWKNRREGKRDHSCFVPQVKSNTGWFECSGHVTKFPGRRQHGVLAWEVKPVPWFSLPWLILARLKWANLELEADVRLVWTD